MVRTGAAIVFLALASTSVVHADTKPFVPSQIRGLNPELIDQYTASPSNTFRCLDGSREIPVSAINDDYCDCPDGSDEPGTSACESRGGWFWCKNEGHIPGRVRFSRVNDGICDPECCDGSDEWQTGACADRCTEIGKEYRATIEAEAKTRKTGAKIRGTYIKWAVNEKKRLEDELEKRKGEVKNKEAEVEITRVQLERTEAKSREDLAKRKQSPLYTYVLTQRLALARLRSKSARLQNELDTLHNILDELSKGYNPNYQDMAVKAAVVGYEEFMKGPEGADPVVEEIEIADGELDDLERKDLEGLLLEEEVEEETYEAGGILYRIDEYIPDALYDSWETVRDLAIDWMIRVGFLGRGSKGASKGNDGPHVAAAREKHNSANADLGRTRSEISATEDTLRKLSSFYGPDGEWKKLDGTCIEQVAGEYTYELCFFGKATQKSNRDGSQNHLGTFQEWKTSEPEGSFNYYSTQYYRNGAKCWNGPNRSATVEMTCGTSNALVSIYEPEKCEYHFKVTTPALCWPAEPQPEKVKEEL